MSAPSRVFGILATCMISVGCTQAPPLSHPHSTPPPPPESVLPAKAAEPSTPAGEPSPGSPANREIPPTPSQSPRVSRKTIAGIEFEGVTFDSRLSRLVVVDQPGGPGSRYPDSRSAAASRNGLAAFNAGFFTPEGGLLGKIVSNGSATGSWNKSSLGSGVFRESSSGTLSIARRSGSQTTGNERELLQAGPLLKEGGNAVTGLEATKPAVRMFIAWDGGHRWWIGRSSSCTLAQLGAALNLGSPASWSVREALNLDGGRSADLWVSDKIAGGPTSFRPLWNRPVRNFLVLVSR